MSCSFPAARGSGRLLCEDNGRPCITAGRELLRHTQVNIAIRWFTGCELHEALPHHSSLTRIRQRWSPELFMKIFRRIVQDCNAHGLIYGETLHIDAVIPPQRMPKPRNSVPSIRFKYDEKNDIVRCPKRKSSARPTARHAHCTAAAFQTAQPEEPSMGSDLESSLKDPCRNRAFRLDSRSDPMIAMGETVKWKKNL